MNRVWRHGRDMVLGIHLVICFSKPQLKSIALRTVCPLVGCNERPLCSILAQHYLHAITLTQYLWWTYLHDVLALYIWDLRVRRTAFSCPAKYYLTLQYSHMSWRMHMFIYFQHNIQCVILPSQWLGILQVSYSERDFYLRRHAML